MGEEKKHVLEEFAPKRFMEFEEWRKRWEVAEYLEEKLGLLHGLISHSAHLTDPWQAEMVRFLLRLADGYGSYTNFTTEMYGVRDVPQVVTSCQEIARKAFQVLCLKFFRTDERKNPAHFWWWALADQQLFEKLLWFTRFDKRETRPLHNFHYRAGERDFDNDHLAPIFRGFLDDFAKNGGWNRYLLIRPFRELLSSNDERDTAILDRLDAAKPHLVRILCGLGEYPFLEGKELDNPCIRTLEEMLPGFNGETGRISRKDLNKAALANSPEARVVLVQRAKRSAKRK